MSEKEVKLVDAELYRKILKSEMFQLDDEHRLDIQRAIILLDQTPAIVLPHGRWKVVQINGTCTTFACSECSREVKATNDYFGKPTEHIAEKYPYCHCGAKMEVDNV